MVLGGLERSARGPRFAFRSVCLRGIVRCGEELDETFPPLGRKIPNGRAGLEEAHIVQVYGRRIRNTEDELIAVTANV